MPALMGILGRSLMPVTTISSDPSLSRSENAEPRWKPFRAGLAMVAAASLPLFWQVIFTDSDAPGFAFLFAVMLVPATAVILLGVVAAIYRLLWPGGEWT